MEQRKKKHHPHTIQIRSAILLAVTIILLGVFTACSGLSASNDGVNTTEKHYTREDPPEMPTIKMPDTIPEYNDDIVEPLDPEYITYYVASSESNKYHTPSCHYVDQILPRNIIYFYSRDSARREGYSPCSVCNP